MVHFLFSIPSCQLTYSRSVYFQDLLLAGTLVQDARTGNFIDFKMDDEKCVRYVPIGNIFHRTGKTFLAKYFRPVW